MTELNIPELRKVRDAAATDGANVILINRHYTTRGTIGFNATFDPEMVGRLLDRIAELEGRMADNCCYQPHKWGEKYEVKDGEDQMCGKCGVIR